MGLIFTVTVNIKPFFHLFLLFNDFAIAGQVWNCPTLQQDDRKVSSMWCSHGWWKGCWAVAKDSSLMFWWTSTWADPWDDAAQVDHERLPATGAKWAILNCIISVNAFQEWDTSHGSCFELALQGRLSTVSIQQTTTCSSLLGSNLSSIAWLHFDVMRCSGVGRLVRLL